MGWGDLFFQNPLIAIYIDFFHWLCYVREGLIWLFVNIMYLHTHTLMCTHIYMRACISVCMFMHETVCVCVCVYMYVCVQIRVQYLRSQGLVLSFKFLNFVSSIIVIVWTKRLILLLLW